MQTSERKRKSLRKRLAAAAVAAAVIGTAGVAYGFWTSSGTGTGSATAGTSTPWVVTTDPASGGLLTPGGPTDTVAIHVTNTSSGSQALASVVIKVANAAGTPWTPGGCDASDFSVGGQAAGAIYTIPYSPVVNVAAGATYDTSVSLQMLNKPTTNQDGCKLITVPLHVTAS